MFTDNIKDNKVYSVSHVNQSDGSTKTITKDLGITHTEFKIIANIVRQEAGTADVLLRESSAIMPQTAKLKLGSGLRSCDLRDGRWRVSRRKFLDGLIENRKIAGLTPVS